MGCELDGTVTQDGLSEVLKDLGRRADHRSKREGLTAGRERAGAFDGSAPRQARRRGLASAEAAELAVAPWNGPACLRNPGAAPEPLGVIVGVAIACGGFSSRSYSRVLAYRRRSG